MAQRIWGVRRAIALAVTLIALGLIAPSALAAGSAGVAASHPSRSGARAATTLVGAAPVAQKLSLALPLRTDQAGLARFAAAVSTPGSPLYGQYEPVATLARRFGAPGSERAHVVDYLRHAGATGVKIDATGLFADASVSVADAQRLFGVSLEQFRTGTGTGTGAVAGAARFVSPTSAARVPAGLAGDVTGVVGLDTRPLAQGPTAPAALRPSRVAASAEGTAGAGSGNERTGESSAYGRRTGTAAGCPAAVARTGFTPNQYLTAYGYGGLQAAGIQGQGERVALIEIDGFRSSDVHTFATCFGLPTPKVNALRIGIKKPLAPGGESTLDLEILTAAAPRLHAIDVYESGSTATDVLRSLTTPLISPGRKPNVISASLGSCEAATVASIGVKGVNVAEAALELAAASGISVLASTGDTGSTACVTNKGPLDVLAVNYPASSPFVTAVGGTNIVLNPANQIADPATDQIVWNDSPLLVGAAGGGISGLFRRPSYQLGFAVPDHRIIPDVSMLADPLPGYEIYCTAHRECVKSSRDSPWVTFGGTSAGTPLLAGGLALVDESLRRQGRQDVGFANPLLYKLDHSPAAASVISNVVTGSNDLGQAVFGRPVGCCTATPGFNQASGLGSVNVAGLALTAPTVVPRIVGVGLTLPGQPHAVAAERLLATVSCSGRCLMGAYAKLQIGRSGRPLTRFSNLYVLRRRNRRTIAISLDHATLTKLHAGSRRHQRITATVYGAIVDPAGNIERHTRGRTLKLTG